MASLNIPEKYALERGGYSSPSVMKIIYQGTMQEKKKEVDATMNHYFESIVGNL